MTPFAKFVVFTLVAGAVYYAVSAKVQEETRRSKSPPVAGWKELEACSPMRSLDGTRELTFLKDQSVKLLEREAKTLRALRPSKAAGAWAFEEASKRYLMTLGSGQESYVFVRPEDSEVCILARGELRSSDMSESWYGRTLSDMQGDLTDADR